MPCEMLRFERVLWGRGCASVAGVDEVGMGPLAGPVVAAAVILPTGMRINGIRDSKRLSALQRQALDGDIRLRAVGIGIGVVEVGEIDRSNIYRAGLLAMARAVKRLPREPHFVLVDARTIPGIPWLQRALIRGDAKSQSIAAASIIAKVHRDRIMGDYDSLYPQYGFQRHKGYPTREHQRALAEHGPCPIHRRSFSSVREFAGRGSSNYYRLKLALGEVTDLPEWKIIKEDLSGILPHVSSYESKKLKLLLRRAYERLQSDCATEHAGGEKHR